MSNRIEAIGMQHRRKPMTVREKNAVKRKGGVNLVKLMAEAAKRGRSKCS